jgi:hypothetical protein|tara:strand:- start:1220 stop:1450 length:231 start_codon:yes stop_codon:yes gene_type:complete
MITDTKQLAVYVLRWLDRHGLGDTDLREVVDLMGNYSYSSLERAIERVEQYMNVFPISNDGLEAWRSKSKKVMENE